MTSTVEIYIDQGDETVPLGICRYVAKRRGQSSVFEYDSRWLERKNAFAVDPQNLPLQTGPIYTSSEKTQQVKACLNSWSDFPK